MPTTAPRRLLCLTMMGYKKAGIDETDLCRFQVNKYANIISPLMEKYGIVSYTVTHNGAKPRALLSKLFDPKRVAFADHDFIVQIVFPEIENFLRLKADPTYLQRIAQDHLNYSDPTDEAKRTRMTLGYVHEVVRDGKVTFVEENEAIACDMYNDCFDGESGKFEMNGGSNGVH